MTDPVNPKPLPAGPDPGLLSNLSGFMGAATGYLKTRLELFGLEGKQAAVHLGFALAFGVASAFFLLFFWALLMVALGLLIFSPPAGWYWYLAGVAGAHVALGVGVYLLTKLRVLTVSIPTVAATLFLWSALTAGLGLYLHIAAHNLGGIFLFLAFLHVVLAATLVLAATVRARKISLRNTLAELQKDREWLNNLKTQAAPPPSN